MKLKKIRIEEAVAKSFKALGTVLKNWDETIPRTISVLPIAVACQANCRFCFSKASVSADYEGKIQDWERIESVLHLAKKVGARRALISGGGEPTLLKAEDLIRLVRLCGEIYNRVILINNGYRFAKMKEEDRAKTLFDLDRAGLSICAISRHHHDAKRNQEIMGIDTLTENVLQTYVRHQDFYQNLKMRFVCVLQAGGVDSEEELKNYLTWAVENGVYEINFKELYVSTSEESPYSTYEANEYCADNQVSLRLILKFTKKYGWKKVAELPWGAPIFRGEWNGRLMQIAAYTEPSVYWERSNGICRSWNLMATGQVLASLEDPFSEVLKP